MCTHTLCITFTGRELYNFERKSQLESSLTLEVKPTYGVTPELQAHVSCKDLQMLLLPTISRIVVYVPETAQCTLEQVLNAIIFWFSQDKESEPDGPDADTVRQDINRKGGMPFRVNIH